MDNAQLAQMVNWLDEEHRRDRAEIARLQQRLEAQSSDIIEQARRIQELEGRLAGTQAHLGKFGQIEHAIQNTKVELTGLVERIDEGRVQSQRELERSRLSDREMLSREISEVRKELPRITRLEESIDIRSVEDNRLSELIMGVRNQIGALSKEIEERTRQIPFLSEQRTSDTKRIAQLQQETVELFKRLEAVSGRVPLLEEAIRKSSGESEKIPPQIEAMREQQIGFMEQIRATIVDREQVIHRWQEAVEEQKTMVAQAYERVQSFSQQIDVSRRAVHEMQEFKDLILREQSQVQELQRLAEERIRRDMDEFREDFEKKRRKADLRQEHLWSEQDKFNREVVERFPPIYHDLKVHEVLVQHLWKLQETYGNYFLVTAQAWLDGMQGAAKARDEKMRMMEEEWQRQRRNAELYANQVSARRTTGIVSGDGVEQKNGSSRG
jgi:chromosome segregation ATPase